MTLLTNLLTPDSLDPRRIVRRLVCPSAAGLAFSWSNWTICSGMDRGMAPLIRCTHGHYRRNATDARSAGPSVNPGYGGKPPVPD
jgi:hypothetical protein